LLFPGEKGFRTRFHIHYDLHLRSNIRRIFPVVKENSDGGRSNQKREGRRKAKYITAKKMMPIQMPFTTPSMPRRRWSHGEVSMQRRMTIKMPPRGGIVLARQYDDVKAPALIVPISSA
jgi:hypothetical protein